MFRHLLWISSLSGWLKVAASEEGVGFASASRHCAAGNIMVVLQVQFRQCCQTLGISPRSGVFNAFLDFSYKNLGF